MKVIGTAGRAVVVVAVLGQTRSGGEDLGRLREVARAADGAVLAACDGDKLGRRVDAIGNRAGRDRLLGDRLVRRRREGLEDSRTVRSARRERSSQDGGLRDSRTIRNARHERSSQDCGRAGKLDSDGLAGFREKRVCSGLCREVLGHNSSRR